MTWAPANGLDRRTRARPSYGCGRNLGSWQLRAMTCLDAKTRDSVVRSSVPRQKLALSG